MSRPPRARYRIAAVRERLKSHGGPVLDFAVGPYRDAMPDSVRTVLEGPASDAVSSALGSEELDGFPSAAATMLRRDYGLDVEPGRILAVPGGRPAMSLIASALLEAGDSVVVTEPSYPAMRRIAAQAGARVVAIPLSPRRGFAPDLDALPAEATSTIRMFALNYPNNPTGSLLGEADLDLLLARCPAGAILFNDATYGPLTYEGRPWSLLAAAAGRTDGPRLLELHSLAKLYGLGAAPVAFLTGDAGLIDELREFSEYAWSAPSLLFVRLARLCLSDADHLTAVRSLYRERIDRLRGVIGQLGFEPYPTPSGMYVFCPCPREVGGASVASAEEAAERLMSLWGLAVVPWDLEPDRYLRFSARYRIEDLELLAGLGRNGAIVCS